VPPIGAIVGEEVPILAMRLASSRRTGEAHGAVARTRPSVSRVTMCPMTLPTNWRSSAPAASRLGEVQHPGWQARSVGQSAIIRKQVGAKVLGERHVHRVSEGDVCP
jgi:hypothetical protein